MTAPSEETQRKVREWLAYADDDLRFAHMGLSLPGEQRPLTTSLPTMLSNARRSISKPILSATV
jgi:hypothetical protein